MGRWLEKAIRRVKFGLGYSSNKTNRPKVISIALVKSGYMLEQPGIPRYSDVGVTMCRVRPISRKLKSKILGSSETLRQTPLGEDKVRAAWRHAEASRNV